MLATFLYVLLDSIVSFSLHQEAHTPPHSPTPSLIPLPHLSTVLRPVCCPELILLLLQLASESDGTEGSSLLAATQRGVGCRW